MKHQTHPDRLSPCLQLHNRALAELPLITVILQDSMRRHHLFQNLPSPNRHQSLGALRRLMSLCQAMVLTQGVPPTPATTLLLCTGHQTFLVATNGALVIDQANRCEATLTSLICICWLTFNIGPSPRDVKASLRPMQSSYLTKRASYH